MDKNKNKQKRWVKLPQNEWQEKNQRRKNSKKWEIGKLYRKSNPEVSLKKTNAGQQAWSKKKMRKITKY